MEASYNIGAGGKHVHPNAYTIKQFRLFPHNIKFREKEADEEVTIGDVVNEAIQKVADSMDGGPSADIINAVQSFSFAESITQPSIMGEVVIVDATNMIENYRIQGGEKVRIIIQQNLPEEEKEINLTLYISEVLGLTKGSIGSQSYKLTLVTKEHFKNALFKLNEYFSGTAVNIVEGIIKSELGGTIAESSIPAPSAITSIIPEGTINPSLASSNKLSGIYPKLRPFDAINWVLRNANDTLTPIFLYQTLQGFPGYTLKSYRQMIAEGVYSKYNNKPFGLTQTVEDEGFYDLQRTKIQDFTVNSYSDKMQKARNGVYAATAEEVSIDNKKHEKFTYTYTNPTKLNEFKPFTMTESLGGGFTRLNDKEFINSRNYFINRDSDYHQNLATFLPQTVASYENLSDTSMTIQLFGDPHLSPGAVIELKMFKDQAKTAQGKDENLDNALLGGKYLVSAITHSFSGQGYIMSVNLLKDSSKINFEVREEL